MEERILAALRTQGFPATSVELDPAKLKGGYICDTMRVFIGYAPIDTGSKPTSPVGDKKLEFPTSNAREEATARIQGDKSVEQSLPKSVAGRPATAILKMASPLSNDHDVAMRLRLYEREWHFYEHMAQRVPVRVAQLLGSVKDQATGLITEGVVLEDLEIPGAELCPKLDDNGVLTTVTHCARQHAQFWNNPELSSGALGIKPHNSPWYQPVWGNDLNSYWPRFEKKWRARGTAGDAMGPGLPEEAYGIGRAIVENFAWVQDELSSKPHTFNHGDVKPPNMFMMPGGTPAFIDWQYTAVGKGCQDILFFLIEGYTEAECRRLEPIVMAHYHAALVQHGVSGYSFDDLRRDWKLACMHFPFYVAMWFGTTPDDDLVDPGFPRRFVPRAFDAIMRNEAHLLLPSMAKQVPQDLPCGSSGWLLALCSCPCHRHKRPAGHRGPRVRPPSRHQPPPAPSPTHVSARRLRWRRRSRSRAPCPTTMPRARRRSLRRASRWWTRGGSVTSSRPRSSRSWGSPRV